MLSVPSLTETQCIFPMRPSFWLGHNLGIHLERLSCFCFTNRFLWEVGSNLRGSRPIHKFHMGTIIRKHFSILAANQGAEACTPGSKLIGLRRAARCCLKCPGRGTTDGVAARISVCPCFRSKFAACVMRHVSEAMRGSIIVLRKSTRLQCLLRIIPPGKVESNI